MPRLESRGIFFMVGTARFELTTSRTPSERATRLRYVPKSRILRLILPTGFVKLDRTGVS